MWKDKDFKGAWGIRDDFSVNLWKRKPFFFVFVLWN